LEAAPSRKAVWWDLHIASLLTHLFTFSLVIFRLNIQLKRDASSISPLKSLKHDRLKSDRKPFSYVYLYGDSFNKCISALDDRSPPRTA